MSGDKAQEEQDFIDGSEARKARREEELRRQSRRVFQLEDQLADLEIRMEQLKEKQRLETTLATWQACKASYARNKEIALLTPVCQELFFTLGLPDSAFDIDPLRVPSARFELAQERQSLEKLRNPEKEAQKRSTSALTHCIGYDD